MAGKMSRHTVSRRNFLASVAVAGAATAATDLNNKAAATITGRDVRSGRNHRHYAHRQR